MLLNLLFSGDMRALLVGLLIMIPAVLICLTVHECAHGLAAYALGDHTAERAGRLTLDPMAHIDPWGFLCLLLVGFGWARPVPVNVSNFKNRRAGDCITSLAGPVSNLILAVVAFFIAAIMTLKLPMNTNFQLVVFQFLYYLGSLSVGLGVFNLIPIYPLDGSHVLNSLLPFDAQRKLQQFVDRYQAIILLAVIFIVWRGGIDILIGFISGHIKNFAGHIAMALFL